MPVTSNLELAKFVPVSGPGVDALESRKENNNNKKITESGLSSYEKVRKGLIAGLQDLITSAQPK